MRTDPLHDAIDFLLGRTPDHVALGPLQLPATLLFAVLLLASILIAVAVWSRSPAQRTPGQLGIWLFRVLMGAMWFQGALWKLPLPVSGGLQYWTEQMAENAAVPQLADFVRTTLLTHMDVLDPIVLAAELGMATSFMLGLFVRPVATLGILYVAGLWLGLYRNGGEWPWTYVFIMIVHGQFAIDGAGRALGLDALRTRPRGYA